MNDTNSRRVATRLATLCIALVLTGAVLGAIAPTAAAGATTLQENTTNTTNSSSPPTQAEQLRVTPANPDADYLSIEAQTSDEVYNTTGPYATFTLSESVDAARIEQPKANARILGDGTTLRIEYEDDAANGTNASLYTVDLFFVDDSQHTLELYATQTGVSLAAAEYDEYSNVLDYLNEQAQSNGYDSTPEGTMDYVKQTEEDAQLFNSLFTDHVMMFISIVFAAARNFVTWVVGIAIVAGLAIFLERKHGWILRLQQMAEPRGELILEALRQEYEKRRNTAAKHSLSDVKNIGTNSARYWRDSGVETVDDMVEVTCKGVVALTKEGEIKYDENGNQVFAHHGVDDLMDVEPLTADKLRSETWLGPMILEGRLAPTTALSNIEDALLVAEKEYNRGNEVRDARRAVSELNARLAGRRDSEHAETSSNAARPDPRTDFGGAATGGD